MTEMGTPFSKVASVFGGGVSTTSISPEIKITGISGERRFTSAANCAPLSPGIW
jgi:hypothetical protein